MKARHALLPVKSFARAKSRLAAVLGGPEREVLARTLAERSLAALRETGWQVLVITDGADVRGWASGRAEVMSDPAGAERLAQVVDAGLAELARRGAERALVLMADLPGVTADDLEQLDRMLDEYREVVAPDHRGRGTSALGRRAPFTAPTHFGAEDSFARHQAAADGRAAVLVRAGLAEDLDVPEDLTAFAQLAGRRPGAR